MSGCIPADKDGNLTEGSIADKTEQCCKNIIAVLEAAGTTIDKVVKVSGPQMKGRPCGASANFVVDDRVPGRHGQLRRDERQV